MQVESSHVEQQAEAVVHLADGFVRAYYGSDPEWPRWLADLIAACHRVGDGDRYRVALEKIANEDFRGNRPWSATVAFEALNGGAS